MKKCIIAFALSLMAVPFFAQSGTVKVKVTSLENAKGDVVIGLYNSSSTFPTYGKQFKGQQIQADKNGVEYTFVNLPEGTYAVGVWHDENRNEKLDKNFFGVPTEEYGFSKNIYGVLSPPAFRKVSFKVEDGETVELTVKLD